jgi:hypothetical protein
VHSSNISQSLMVRSFRSLRQQDGEVNAIPLA